MKKKQRAELNMSDRTKNLLNGIDPTILALIPFLVLWFTDIKDRLIALALEIQAFDEIIKGFQKTRRLTREALILAAMDLAAQIQAYANSIDDMTLFNNMAFTRTMFDRASPVDLKAITQNIANAASEHMAVLLPFGVTPASLTAFIATRTAFVNADPKPEAAKLEKQAATVAVEAALIGIRALWVKIDRAMKGARATQPILAQDYFRARKIIDLPTRTNAVQVLVTTVGGVPMPFVTVTSATLGLNRKTTKKGRLIIKSGEHMEHVLIFNFPGYKEVKRTVTITTGLRVNIVVIMEALSQE